ncbi:MAG: two-component sensor histidine kinase [Clostridia bacterium]|nr:two-component sensor histidine kinase [Clostridia bacterium]
MIRMIFRNTILVGATVLVLCAALFFGLDYTHTKEEACEALRDEAVYAEQGLMLSGMDYLKALGNINRVTWIDQEGTVLFDNMFSNNVSNQKAVPEVEAALNTGEGYVIRKSESSGENMMYYALRCDDGTILRLSRAIGPLRNALKYIMPMIWVLVLALMISLILAFRAAKQIVRPINEMNLDNLDHPPYAELAPLTQRIQEQNLTIREENLQQEKMRREFSANVSHELKTPLTSMSGFAELMAQGIVPQEKVPEFAADMYRESQRLIALVDDILRLSKLDENAEEPEWEDVDLMEVSADTMDSLRTAADKRKVSLILEGDHVHVKGVFRLLSEMVYNLCDNAIKYNRDGGSVTIRVGTQDEVPYLEVADTGIGIAQEHIGRIFERFYRVDKSHSKELGGTGLGLSIVKHGAQFHGAQISVESEIDQGTTIRLTFSGNAEKSKE